MKICVFELSNEKYNFSKTEIYFHKKTTPQLLEHIGLQNMKVGGKTNFGQLATIFVRWMLTSSLRCRIGGSYLQEKSLPLLFLETLWSCHGESGKWKFERTVTLMGRWPKTNVYHIERGIYRVDHLKRNCIATI